MSAAFAIPSGTMTAEEFFAWANQPEFNESFFELDRGRPVERRRHGSGRHGAGCGLVNYVFGQYLFIQRRCGYGLSNNAGLVVERNPDTVFAPDFMAFARPKIEPPSRWFVTTPPDVVVEVLEAEDDIIILRDRAERLLRFGVRTVWLVCTELLAVTVIRSSRPDLVLSCGDTFSNFPELPGFSCPVAALFTLPGQHPPTAAP